MALPLFCANAGIIGTHEAVMSGVATMTQEEVNTLAGHNGTMLEAGMARAVGLALVAAIVSIRSPAKTPGNAAAQIPANCAEWSQLFRARGKGVAVGDFEVNSVYVFVLD